MSRTYVFEGQEYGHELCTIRVVANDLESAEESALDVLHDIGEDMGFDDDYLDVILDTVEVDAT